MTPDTIAARIDPETRDELAALSLERGRPLVAVDCDEVIVEFSGHVARWLETIGFEMRLERYELEGSMFAKGSDVPVPFDDCLRLLDRFFEEETIRQVALDGAVDAMRALGERAQVIVLTNVPRHARADRLANLDGLGVSAPVVVNSGGKGRALAWLEAQVAAPVVFIDDSAKQIESAAKHAPGVGRVHFTGSPFIRDVLHPCGAADHVAEDWSGALAAIDRLAAARG